MKFTDIFIKRPVLSLVLTLFLILVGVQSGIELSLRQYPAIEKSVIYVKATYPGASARTVQGFVTSPLQKKSREQKESTTSLPRALPGNPK